MKAQPNERTRWRPVKLLLAGDEDELDRDAVRRTLDGGRRVRIARSASLLGALERMQTEPADIVLLSHNFADDEVGVFLSNARRAGFEGLILRIASATAVLPETQSSLDAGIRNGSLPGMRLGPDLPRPTGNLPSFTERQRAVLAAVCEGRTNVQAAQQLECTEAAIKATLQQIFKKLGVRKRSQVVRLACAQGMVEEVGKAASRRRTNRTPPFVAPSPLKGQQKYDSGDFVIDVAMHRVWVRGMETHLTPSEFELLEVFTAHPDELVRSTTLCKMFWRNPTAKQDSLRVLVRGLRAKIEMSKIPQYIVTERNFGYRFYPRLARPKSSRSLV